MFAEKQGWWLLKEIRVLPVEGEKISPTLWVQEVVYIGNSKFFVADELNKNWHCVLLNKRKTAAKKKRPKKKNKKPAKNSDAADAAAGASKTKDSAAAKTKDSAADAKNSKSSEPRTCGDAVDSPRKRARAGTDDFVICNVPYVKVLALIQERDMEKLAPLAKTALTRVRAIEDPAGTITSTTCIHDTPPRHVSTTHLHDMYPRHTSTTCIHDMHPRQMVGLNSCLSGPGREEIAGYRHGVKGCQKNRKDAQSAGLVKESVVNRSWARWISTRKPLVCRLFRPGFHHQKGDQKKKKGRRSQDTVKVFTKLRPSSCLGNRRT